MTSTEIKWCLADIILAISHCFILNPFNCYGNSMFKALLYWFKALLYSSCCYAVIWHNYFVCHFSCARFSFWLSPPFSLPLILHRFSSRLSWYELWHVYWAFHKLILDCRNTIINFQ